MQSTNPNTPSMERTPDWRAAGLRYHALGFYFRRRFGHRVWKVSVDGGFTCPNSDGTVGTGGCIFCNIRSFSPSRRLGLRSISDQIEEGTRRLGRRYGAERFVAYLQPATNTYGALDRLAASYREAIARHDVVGLVVGTRPDCVPDPVLDLLAEISQQTWLLLELGLQTIHDHSLDWMRRGHHYDAFLDAVERARRRGLAIGAHVILGLPGETREHTMATARELARLRIHSVKLHNLYAARDTPLAEGFMAGEIHLPDREEHVRNVVDFLEHLPPECVIDRLGGDAPPDFLVAPKWCLDKPGLIRSVEAELERRDTWQGRVCDGGVLPR